MFNGIIYNTGIAKIISKSPKNILLGVKTKMDFKKKDLGSSVSCDGVCLTLFKFNKNIIYFYISNETIKRSNFKHLKINQLINLEKSITYGDQISGNFIQGHVDSTATIKKISFIDKTWLIKFEIKDQKLKKYLMEKASISINGVSLTISKVYDNFFEINVIPHTLKLTNLRKLKTKNLVNVELDIFSKYMYKYSN
jgi:riboflavin synthase